MSVDRYLGSAHASSLASSRRVRPGTCQLPACRSGRFLDHEPLLPRPSPIAIVWHQFSDHDRSRLEPMDAMKPKSFASQPKRQSETTPPPVRAEDKPSRLTFGLPGNMSRRAERRRALMGEHRETLRRLGE